MLFQSTPPVWVVTAVQMLQQKEDEISIHTTRVGGDPSETFTESKFRKISIHTTRVGGDSLIALVADEQTNFNPHHPCGW